MTKADKATRQIHTKRFIALSEADYKVAWVLSCRRVGDNVAGWVVEEINRKERRYLENSERCEITAFCYPTGAKLVLAKLAPEKPIEQCA